MISSDEFNALLAAQEPPETQPDPEPVETAPIIPPTPEPPEPVVEEPDTPPTPPAADVTVPLPPSDTPQPAPAERVAPEAVGAPDPDVTPDEVVREAVAPDEGETEVPQDPQEATAPEEAATEIVTEAEEPAGAPVTSIRPSTRPSRPTPTAVEDPPSTAVDDAVAAALADVQDDARSAPSGPPLSQGERDALRVSVSSCWNVGSLSTEALQTTVVVGVDMQENGTPVNGSIQMLSFSGGSEAAARQAFEAARRAIIRCGARGFPLPAEKYDHWREIEMTFNPENMRIR